MRIYARIFSSATEFKCSCTVPECLDGYPILVERKYEVGGRVNEMCCFHGYVIHSGKRTSINLPSAFALIVTSIGIPIITPISSFLSLSTKN